MKDVLLLTVSMNFFFLIFNSNYFRCRKFNLKVRILQTAEDQKWFEVVGIKKILAPNLPIYIYEFIVICHNLGHPTVYYATGQSHRAGADRRRCGARQYRRMACYAGQENSPSLHCGGKYFVHRSSKSTQICFVHQMRGGMKAMFDFLETEMVV